VADELTLIVTEGDVLDVGLGLAVLAALLLTLIVTEGDVLILGLILVDEDPLIVAVSEHDWLTLTLILTLILDVTLELALGLPLIVVL
jgi:hypothetical protein